MTVYILFKFGRIVDVFEQLDHAKRVGASMSTLGLRRWDLCNKDPECKERFWEGINDENGIGAMSIAERETRKP